MTNVLGVRRHNAILTVSEVGSLGILCEIPTVLLSLDWLEINNDRDILNEPYLKILAKPSIMKISRTGTHKHEFSLMNVKDMYRN
jgi:hypothetical protein